MGTTVIDPLVGRLVDGRYHVVSRIARGGMATVYLAVDRRLDREVALKVMHPHLAEGETGAAFVARFRREARSAARLTHPGLVAVFDQGVDGETSYLTMEYVLGGNLRRTMSAAGSLTVGEALDVTEQVLDALAVAHRAGLVHRDIKPENVLIADEGRIKVADFGLARAVTEVTSATSGTLLGTVAYLAPELAVRGDTDARTDVYATGVLLYEMLVGRQPFTGDTPIQVAFAHVNTDVPAPSDSPGADWLPTEVDALVGALAARDPEDRPADAAAALVLLRRTRAALDEKTLTRRVPVTPTLEPDDAGTEDEAAQDGPHGGTTDDGPVGGDEQATSRIDSLTPGGTVALPIGLGVPRPGTDDDLDEDLDGEDRPQFPATGLAAAPGRDLATTTDRAPVPTKQGAPAHPRSTYRRRRWAVLAVVLVLLAAAAGGGVWWYQSAGPGAYTTVPEVTALAQDDAIAALDAAGLGSTVEDAFDDAAAGTVLAADPTDGDRIRKDGTVTLTVSKGPDLVEVPTGLVGAMQADADAAIKAADLAVEYADPVHDDTAPLGQVMTAVGPDGAELADGQQIKRGSTLTLTVSAGPAPVVVPSVVGATLDEATRQLEDEGLVVATEEVWSDTVASGSVVSQNPEGSVGAVRTDTVTLQVSKGPEPVQVPDLTGKQYGEAAATLEALGLQVERDNVLGGIFGTVRDQSVAAGESVPKGSTITLTVV